MSYERPWITCGISQRPFWEEFFGKIDRYYAEKYGFTVKRPTWTEEFIRRENAKTWPASNLSRQSFDYHVLMESNEPSVVWPYQFFAQNGIFLNPES